MQRLLPILFLALFSTGCLANQNIILGTNHGFYISSDSGKTFKNQSSGLHGAHITNLLESSGNYIAGTTFFGAFISENGGQTWTLIKNIPNSVNPITSIKTINEKILIASYCGLYLSEDDGITWKKILSGMIMHLAVSGNTIYADQSLPGKDYLMISNDLGKNWTSELVKMISGRNDSISGLISQGNNIIVGTGFTNTIFSSHNKGLTWSTIQPEFTNFSMSGGVLNGAFLFIEGSSRSPKVSSNGGLSMTTIKAIPWNCGKITFICYGQNVMAVTALDGVFVSNDNGLVGTWKKITSFNPKIEYLSAYHNGNQIIIGTDNGVYISNDNGRSWTYNDVDKNIPNQPDRMDVYAILSTN